MGKYDLQLRRKYAPDEETGPEVFTRGISDMIEDMERRRLEGDEFRNRERAAGGEIIEPERRGWFGRRRASMEDREAPERAAGGGLRPTPGYNPEGSAPPQRQRAGVGDAIGDYIEITGPGGLRSRRQSPQAAARIAREREVADEQAKHDRALALAREQSRLRAAEYAARPQQPRATPRTIDEERGLITHREREQARFRAPPQPSDSDDPSRRRETFISNFVRDAIKPDQDGNRMTAAQAASEARAAWTAIQEGDTPRRNVGNPRGRSVLRGGGAPAGAGAKPSGAERARALSAQGKSREEIRRILTSEGYRVK